MSAAMHDIIHPNLKYSAPLPSGSGRVLPVNPRRSHTGLPAATPPTRKRSWRPFAAMMLVALGGATASYRYQSWKSLAATGDSGASESTSAPRAVTVEHPSPAATASVVLPATIRPWQATSLHARVDGYLAAW